MQRKSVVQSRELSVSYRAGAPASLPAGGRAEAQSARVEMQHVVWPGPPQPRRAGVRGDPRSGESAAMVQVGLARFGFIFATSMRFGHQNTLILTPQ